MASVISAMAMATVLTVCAAQVTAAQAVTDPAVQHVNKPLLSTHWRLVSLEGQAVPPSSATLLVLHSKNQRLEGHTGCVPLAGRYLQRGTQLVFTPAVDETMAANQAPCAPGTVVQQTDFLAALKRADAYRIEGNRLSLLQDETVRAQFVAEGR